MIRYSFKEFKWVDKTIGWNQEMCHEPKELYLSLMIGKMVDLQYSELD